ncbi:hypothetical protein [Sporolituus thermophilus]|uniref:Uncharacterized protein n=1 Tax=Sporolituus thermophilus DSM 23256 TaxID=1123285 RepID=A0A1G7MA77_9FIRM|nr:hypothetical protein [Sporolituus thermophilus]SDF58536.1 hypothetical protein SAMN05660235_02061 [Sporolituus thermophilus DSM 23256]
MRVFKEKTSRFGSLISLIALSALLILFSAALPEFLASAAGRLFAAAWALTAIIIFVAHARRIAPQRQPYVAYLATGRKDVRTRRQERFARAMRG